MNPEFVHLSEVKQLQTFPATNDKIIQQPNTLIIVLVKTSYDMMDKNMYRNLDVMVLQTTEYLLFDLSFRGGIPEEFQVEDAF